jgi:hypothetical protein
LTTLATLLGLAFREPVARLRPQINRDYVRVFPRPNAESVMRQLLSWIAHYNEVHPHKALGYRSPREFIPAHKRPWPCPIVATTVTGESGGGARPLDPQWVRDIISDCRSRGIVPFHKQWGTYSNNPLVVEQGMTYRRGQGPRQVRKGRRLG